ncbi:hypothetical protein GCM10010321_89310 [Streptomyces chartreusis]|nr:hypothetical protein GCM10010321_89310 [Streptomyces chartreusis]
MRSIRRIFSVGTAALVLGAGLVAGSSGAAQAAASDCTGGAQGLKSREAEAAVGGTGLIGVEGGKPVVRGEVDHAE